MSTTAAEFRLTLENALQGATLLQKVHSLHRAYEKLRLIHNAIGAVYRQSKTITQFKNEHPEVFNKIKGELSPFVVGGYLSAEGWNYFLDRMFEPRHDVIIFILLELRQRLYQETAEIEVEEF